MSVLQTPRIYFKGHITWDPIVTNNYRRFYDERGARPLFDGRDVAAYRERARLAVTAGNWNPHGTHRSTLYETTVVGADLGDGPDHDDALVGAPVSLTGMLVDLDPYGATSSQLFFDEMSFGIPGGCRIHGRRSHRFTARRINFTRNPGNPVIAGVASVIWQTSFAKADGLTLDPRGSRAVSALERELSRDDVLGLTVRLNTYRTNYYGAEAITDALQQQLADRIASGGFHPNPARSLVVGTVGLWCTGEPPAVPGDRILVPASDNAELGTAFARLDRDRLVLDLSNSTPETDFAATKKDVGRITVFARAGGEEVALGHLDPDAYDRQAYEQAAGIVVLALDDVQRAAARDGDLAIVTAAGTQLGEQPLLATADVPNLYLETGQRQMVEIRVLERGRTPGRAVKVTVADLQGDPIEPTVLTTDDDGVAALPLRGGRAGEWTWVLLPWTTGAPPTVPTADTFSPEQYAYLSMRTLPADDDLAALEPTWGNVHRHVLRDWEAMAPCMDNWLRLGDEAQCRAYAPLIRKLSDPAQFESFRYMPVTRDLTAGQRLLLHRWCEAVTSPASAGTARLALASPVSATPTGRRPRGLDFNRTFKARGGPRDL